jgi:hypothetical protein
MFRKFIGLICFVIVLGVASNVSADLVVHWTLDDGAGTVATDFSGNGHDGAVNGTANWTVGMSAGALDFDGTSTYIDMDEEVVRGTWSLALWLKPRDIPYSSGFYAVMHTDGWSGGGTHLHLRANTSLLNCDFNSGPDVTTTTVLQADEWYHAVITVTDQPPGGGQMFINGVLEAEGSGGSGGDYLGPMMFGNWSGGARFYHGLMDDIRIYDHILSESEILGAMEGKPWPFAFGPSPEDGAMLEDTWVNLSWTPGQLAVSHDIYMSDSFDAVNDGTADAFQGNQGTTFYVAGFPGFAYPEGLVPGTTYYWRIDEVNDADPNSPWKGDVWSFWIPPKTAYNEIPANGAQFVLSDATLEWTGGFGSKLHTVYFGDNLEDVSNASGGTAQTDTTFTPSTLELNKTYYWRVDEFEAPMTHKGDVWSFTTVPQIEITDPTLVGWWTFDEGRGTTAVDWSGHGNHGSIMNTNDPLWVDGYQITAMDMAGAAYVHVDGDSWSTIENEATIAMWVYGDPAQMPQNNSAFWAHDGGNRVAQAHIPWSDGNVYFDTGGSGYNRINKAATPGEYQGSWRHWTFVKNATTGEQLIYLDGVLWHSGTGLTLPMVNVTSFAIGSANDGGNIFPGMIDDVRLYNKALTVEEIQQVMLGNTKLAGSPVPDIGAIVDIRDIGSLSWSAGDTAASHDVYFGTERGAMELQGNQAGTSLSLADLVEFGGGDYYWRIDEVQSDGAVIAGTVWKFAVPDYLIVDDFESYNDINEGEPGSNRIYLTWIDGFGIATNGSQAGNLDPPFMSQGHSGAQAMPLSYDNAGKTSEATRTLTSKKDWTEQGVTKLALWFRGDSANAADRMFVALGNAIVYHPDDAATQDTGWNEWVIDLQEFANQGTDLTNVGSITLGFGTRGAPVPTGGTGTVHFDDIRLVR